MTFLASLLKTAVPIAKIMKCSLALAFVTFGLCTAALADDTNPKPPQIPPASSQQGVTYAKDIKPIFDKTCIKCHGADRPKAHLRLDSLDGILKGGEDGKVVVAGKSADSLLVKNIAHVGEEEDWMPPVKNRMGLKPLTPEQIGLIRAWIDQGAK